MCLGLMAACTGLGRVNGRTEASRMLLHVGRMIWRPVMARPVLVLYGRKTMSDSNGKAKAKRSGNPNPRAARRARKTKAQQRLGDIEALRERLWTALIRIDRHVAAHTDGDSISDEGFAALRLMPQIAGCFLKACEVGELESRLKALEEQSKES